MDADGGQIKIGVNVDIQRTDGRIHSAIVSGINGPSRSCTVEWYEKGEAKGKEIEFEAVYQFNPHLMPDKNVEETANRPTMAPPTARNGGTGGPKGVGANKKATNNGRPTTHQNIQPAMAPPVAPPAAHIEEVIPPHQPPSYSPPPNDPSFIEDLSPTDYDPAPLGGFGQKKQQQAVKPSRKSHCVKEVERIQQRREERRAAQKAIKEQPDFDSSTPNYEFLQMIRDFQSNLDYKPLTDNDAVDISHRITVCVRKRPLNKKELGRKDIDVAIVPNKDTVIIHEPKLKVDLTKYLENQQFRFDFAFDEAVDNHMVYRFTAKPLVESIFERGMATCFAYGQTGSGKTHTMGGEFHGKGQQDCSNGIYALAARDVFKLLHTKYKNDQLYVEATFFEIYSGKVFDLLNKKQKLRVLEDGKNQVQVVGLKEELVTSVDDVLKLLQHGNHIRTSGQTSANQHSSRSHAIFQLIVKKKQTRKLHGKFSLIDLAGNERGADTSSADRLTRMEGAEINKSLLALKECIRALGRQGAHLPFRASKLTLVLRDSFIGDKSRTCMIAMVSPGMSCCEHTLNTLRYADRVKELDPNSAGNDAQYDAGYDPLSGLVRRQGPSARLPAAGDGGIIDLPSPDDGDSLLVDEDDLAMLRSGNEEEVTEEMLTFHEVVNHIEKMEEEVCDEHKGVIDTMDEWNREHRRLFKLSNQVDYDVEDYASRLERLLNNQIENLAALKDKVVKWSTELKQEEEMSSKMQKSKDVKKK